jgi:hypothetical protein
MSILKESALVSTLKSIVPPRLTLMSVAKPWMLSSPAPFTSHSLARFPGKQFSATISLGGLLQSGASAGLFRTLKLTDVEVPADGSFRASSAAAGFTPTAETRKARTKKTCVILASEIRTVVLFHFVLENRFWMYMVPSRGLRN